MLFFLFSDDELRQLFERLGYDYDPDRLLSSYRFYYTPDIRYFILGFRVVLVGASAR